MGTVIVDNLGTIGVALIIIGIVVAIVLTMIRNKKRGKSLVCSCGCDTCPKKVRGCAKTRKIANLK